MIIWLLFILAEVYRNYYMIEKQKSSPNYGISFVLRAMAAIAHGIYMDVRYDIYPDNMWDYTYWESVLILLPLLIFQTTTFYLLFDPLLNYTRKKPFNDIGEANWLDRFGQKHPKAYWTFKAMIAFVAVVTIVKFSNNIL